MDAFEAQRIKAFLEELRKKYNLQNQLNGQYSVNNDIIKKINETINKKHNKKLMFSRMNQLDATMGSHLLKILAINLC